jgi:hypothetical protein
MPYLDITQPDEFTHIIQLFLAAHPDIHDTHEKIRAQLGDSQAYMVSKKMLHAMAAWGRERQLITRQAAQHMRTVADAMQAAYEQQKKSE